MFEVGRVTDGQLDLSVVRSPALVRVGKSAAGCWGCKMWQMYKGTLVSDILALDRMRVVVLGLRGA